MTRLSKSPKKKRKELASNAEWVLYPNANGSVTAESRKGGTDQVLSAAEIKSMRSLIALVEGSGVNIE